MRTRTRVGTLVALCFAAACSEGPTGVEPFGPQFEHLTGGDTHTYTFDDLPGFCGPPLLEGPYEDLVFPAPASFGQCPGGLFGDPFGGGIALIPLSSGEVFIEFLSPASAVSIEAFRFFPPGPATLVAYDASGAVVGSSTEAAPLFFILSVSASSSPITKIGITVPPGSTYFDNLTITYITELTDIPFDDFTVKKAEIEFADEDDDDDDYDGDDEDDDDGDKFEVEGSFTLGADSDGIDVATEEVIVGFGTFSQTIAAGAFIREDDHEGWEFDDGNLKVTIRDEGEFEVKGRDIDLSGTDASSPVDFSLQIGDDLGDTTIELDDDGKFELDDD